MGKQFKLALKLFQGDTDLKKIILVISVLANVLCSFSAWAAPAEIPKTGQTTVYAADDDGSLQKGIAWPSPRFTPISAVSGTVVADQLTGLVWTQDGNAPGPGACSPATSKTWQGALDYVVCLNTNSYLGYNDWRLPNRKELRSLVNYEIMTAAWLNTQGFTSVTVSSWYWSSSTYAGSTADAWSVAITDGTVYALSKTSNGCVWPVRGGQ